ncbi:MAG: M14 family zinc carboxypeptidase [Exilibacterium sp.]
MMKIFSHLLSPLVLLLAIPISATPYTPTENILLLEQEKANNSIYNAYFPSLEIGKKAAISFHAQLLESHYDEGFLVLELSDNDRDKLKTFGFKFNIAQDFLQKRNAFFTSMQNLLTSAQQNPAVDAQSIGIAAIPGYECYETVEETFAAAQNMVATHPDLAQWIDVGNSWEKTAGVGGYDMNVLILTNQNISGNKPKLFINSAIHAREYITAPLVLAFAHWLLDNYGSEADATWILDHHEVHLMLHTNPDGRKQAESGLLWRKNTNQNYCSPDSESRGVDLNRNFTFTWNSTNGQGSSGSQCSITYRGPSAGSEPEIQALENYVRSLWPDNRGNNRNDPAPQSTSGIHLDIHSYSELVLWPWGDASQTAPNGTALQTLGRKFAYFNDYSPMQSVGLYPTDGTSDSVSYGELGVAAYTFELGTQFFQNCSTYENTIKPENMSALIYAAKVVRTPYITPAGPDIIALGLSNNANTYGVPAGTQVTLSASATDTRFNNSNGTESTQNIAQAEYFIDEVPWDSSATSIALSADDGNYNERTEAISASIDTTGWSEGKHIIYLRSRDTSNTWGAVSAIYLIIDENPDIPDIPDDPVLEYCDAYGNNASAEWISSVGIDSFTHTSGSSPYSNFTEAVTGEVIALNPGTSAVTLAPEFSGNNFNEYWKIWIDLNRDGDFTDSGEEVFSSNGATSSTVTGSLNIPSSAAPGKTTLRVAMRFNTAPKPCGSFTYGEVEDYTVSIGNDQ